MSHLPVGLAQCAAGAVASFAVFLVVTGLGKTYRGWRQLPGRPGRLRAPADDRSAEDDAAIRRALRRPVGAWRLLMPVVGCAEIGTGAAALSGHAVIVACVAMMILGTAFAILLGYARARRVPGGCGCTSWRRRPEPVSWRSILRAALLACAGAGELTTAGANAAVSTLPRPWFAEGALIAAGIVLLAGRSGPLRTPVCRRPVLFAVRRTLRALAGHPAFAEVAAASGPFAPPVLHRRTGCVDQFWLSGRGDTVTFDVQHIGRSLAVRSAVRTGPAAATRPVRADWLE